MVSAGDINVSAVRSAPVARACVWKGGWVWVVVCVEILGECGASAPCAASFFH